jgi:hypothetical protein
MNKKLADTNGPNDAEEGARKLAGAYEKLADAMKGASAAINPQLINSSSYLVPIATTNTPSAFPSMVGYQGQTGILTGNNTITGQTGILTGNSTITGQFMGNPNKYATQVRYKVDEKLCWRLVMGLRFDPETKNQKYTTTSYMTDTKAEAREKFVEQYVDVKFDAIFVMEPTEE